MRSVWLEQCCKRELPSRVRSGSAALGELTLESSCIEYLEFLSCVFELRAKSCIFLEPAKFVFKFMMMFLGLEKGFFKVLGCRWHKLKL